MIKLQSDALRWPQYTAALIANIGALSVGTLLGWMSPASPRLSGKETGVVVSESKLSWVAGCMPLGAVVTPFVVPFLIDRIGRKNTLLAAAPPFVAGFALLAWAQNVQMYYAGRFLCGISGGTFSIVAPVYTAEIGEKSIRGSLGTCYEALLGLGLEVSFVVGGLLPLFWTCIVLGMVPIIFAILFYFMPESPYYHIAQGNDEKAKKSLQWLRGPDYNIADELKEIECNVKVRADTKLRWEDFNTKAARKSILIGVGLMVFQQASGVDAIAFNATRLFEISGSSIEPNLATMIVGLTCLFNLASTLLVDRLGRRKLLITSSFFLTLCSLGLGIFYWKLNNDQDMSHMSWIPLTCMVVFMIMFAMGWGPIAWMMLGEIFPAPIKGVCSSMCCCINWLTVFLVVKFYPDLVLAYGEGISFCSFSVIGALSLVFVYFCVPETKGISLEEIQRQLSGQSAGHGPNKEERLYESVNQNATYDNKAMSIS